MQFIQRKDDWPYKICTKQSLTNKVVRCNGCNKFVSWPKVLKLVDESRYECYHCKKTF